MKIEKISDTQVKFILTRADLADRNIKMSELSYGSEKAQQLFQEMMQQAMMEYDFESANIPLMVEAVPISGEGVMIVVTKLSEAEGMENKLDLVPLARAAMRFKRAEFIEPPEESPEEDSISVFSFDALDTLAAAAAKLRPNFSGVSKAYKMDGRYFLMLQNETEDNRTTADLEAFLYEFGQKHVSNTISRQYLAERGDPLIASGAVEKLSTYHQ
ncbi:MAG: adaptor protein MecA [Clostridiales bacterium]|jgi:adapter protein MecA 1/2|nr:adaptor protein MecA [Clostridiales bacterium]